MVSEKSVAGVRLLVDSDDGTHVAFTDRNGGVSAAPYDTLNLATRGGDDPVAVTENRSRVAAACGWSEDRLALARQVHGDGHLRVSSGQSGVIGEADVLSASDPDVVLGILTADCAPVVLIGPQTIGLVHAGWRGVVARAVDSGVASVGEVTRAWIGPSIHACCYEVGPEVVEAFARLDLPIAADDRVDPARAAEVQLHRAGVSDVEVSDVCTSCDPRYFSYRRDGVTGRQGAFVWRAAR